jgi:hypothetical protein
MINKSYKGEAGESLAMQFMKTQQPQQLNDLQAMLV